MKRYMFLLLGLIALVVAVAQVKAMRSSNPPSKPVVANAALEESVSAEGRVSTYPGSEVVVGTEIAGVVDRVLVEEKQSVHRGDVLAILRADDLRAALAEAQSRVGESDADIRLFDAERVRARTLFEQQVGSRQTWDKAERDFDAARARRGSAVAEVSRLKAQLEKAVIKAPFDGSVTVRNVHPGQALASGDPIVSLADLSKRRVEAEIDEFDTARVKLGAPVTITAEGFDEKWEGTVEEIPDAVVSRRLKPQDPSKPIDARVLLVKVRLDDDTPLKLGQRVEVEVH